MTSPAVTFSLYAGSPASASRPASSSSTVAAASSRPRTPGVVVYRSQPNHHAPAATPPTSSTDSRRSSGPFLDRRRAVVSTGATRVGARPGAGRAPVGAAGRVVVTAPVGGVAVRIGSVTGPPAGSSVAAGPAGGAGWRSRAVVRSGLPSSTSPESRGSTSVSSASAPASKGSGVVSSGEGTPSVVSTARRGSRSAASSG